MEPTSKYYIIDSLGHLAAASPNEKGPKIEKAEGTWLGHLFRTYLTGEEEKVGDVYVKKGSYVNYLNKKLKDLVDPNLVDPNLVDPKLKDLGVPKSQKPWELEDLYVEMKERKIDLLDMKSSHEQIQKVFDFVVQHTAFDVKLESDLVDKHFKSFLDKGESYVIHKDNDKYYITFKFKDAQKREEVADLWKNLKFKGMGDTYDNTFILDPKVFLGVHDEGGVYNNNQYKAIMEDLFSSQKGEHLKGENLAWYGTTYPENVVEGKKKGESKKTDVAGSKESLTITRNGILENLCKIFGDLQLIYARYNNNELDICFGEKDLTVVLKKLSYRRISPKSTESYSSVNTMKFSEEDAYRILLNKEPKKENWRDELNNALTISGIKGKGIIGPLNL